VAAGAVPTVDADTALRQHWITVEAAGRAGLRQYEISNFARPGAECRHNLAYWHNDFYLAAGVGAHGHLPPGLATRLGITPPHAAARDVAAVRYWHTDSIADYVAGAPLGVEAVSAAQRAQESILVGLRLTAEGVELPGDARTAREAGALRDAGLLTVDGRTARVTARGQELLDAVALRLCDARAA
jgi:oxygen-independent coproporphyrinogen-3 oxidase